MARSSCRRIPRGPIRGCCLRIWGRSPQRLQFASNIYLAALRDPLTVAKSVASAAVLTGNRVVCGVSAGWLREEYELAGVDFEQRGRRLDETLLVMRKLLTGQVVKHEGPLFRFEGIMCPAPTQPVRIWCGGAAAPAMRRAARHDGWLPLPMTVAQADTALGGDPHHAPRCRPAAERV